MSSTMRPEQRALIASDAVAFLASDDGRWFAGHRGP
jgi:hypothetical protein